MQHTSHFAILTNKALAILLAIAMAIALCPLPTAGPAFADELSDKQAEAETALANLTAMQNELDRLSSSYGVALMAQAEAEQKRDEAQARIEEIQAQIEVLQERLGSRARDMYRGGSTSLIDLLLGSASFVEFATNWDVLNKVNSQDAELVAEQKALRAEAEEQAEILEEQAKLAAENSDAAAQAAARAEATVSEMQSIYDGLSAEVLELVEQQRQAEEAAAAERARQEAERQAALESNNNGGGSNWNGGGNGGGSTNGGAGGYNPWEDNTPVQKPYEGGTDPVSRAYACLGAPYVWGATGPYGYDCSGLVGYCLTGSHSRLGTTATFINWPVTNDPQPGDVCVVHVEGGDQHTGIYIGGGQMIHAATYGVGVIIGPVQAGMVIVKYPG